MRGVWALSALLLCLARTGPPASAQPEPADQARAARLITLTVATDTDEDVTQIVSYLRPLVEMRGLLLAVRRVDSVDAAPAPRSGSQPGLRARVWLDLKTPKQAKILFAAGDQVPPTGRVVPTAARMDQVAAAEIAEIILADLMAPESALATAAPSGGPPPQLSAGPPAAAPPGTWQRSLGILGAAQTWARGAAAVPEVGLSVLLEWQPASAAWSRAVWSTLRYRPPFRPADSPLRLRVRGGEAELLAVLAHRLGRRGTVGIAAGMGLDARLSDATPPSGTTLANEQPVRELAAFLRTAVRFDLAIGGPLSLFAALTVDLFPLQARLLVRQSGAARPVFTPWPLRPGALTGASLVF